MFRQKFIVTLVFLVCAFAHINAQNNEVHLSLRGGDNAVFGAFGSASLDFKHNFGDAFALRGGAQYNTIGQVTTEIRPTFVYELKDLDLKAVAILNYTHQQSISAAAAGLGVGVSGRVVSATVGYFYRQFVAENDKVTEPINYFYELAFSCLPSIEDWDLLVKFTNSEIFEVERQYYPTYMIQGWWYPQDILGFNFGLNYKPAGMFNMSVDFYQLYANFGLCYKW